MVIEPLSAVRTVRRISLVDEGEGEGEGGRFRFEFELDGALYKMVRNMVGVLWSVGSGSMEVEQVAELLALKDRQRNLVKPAPPEGLTLEKVLYEDY